MVYVLPRRDGVATDCRATGVAKVTAYREKRERKQRMCRGADTRQSADRRLPSAPTDPDSNGGNARPGRMFIRSHLQIADRCNAVCRPPQPSGSRDEGRRDQGPGTKGPRGQETGTGREEALDPAGRPEEVSLPQAASPTPLPRGCKPST